MNCPVCNAQNAYVGLIHVSCPNESCANYDPAQAVPTPSGEIQEVEDDDGELWGLSPEWRVFVQKALGHKPI